MFLLFGTIRSDVRTGLAVGDPVITDRRSATEEFLHDHESFHCASTVATVFGRQRHPEPTFGAEIFRELGVDSRCHAET